MRHFSIQTIILLVDAVTGGSFCQRTGSIGKYRSAPEIEMFLGAAGIEVNIGGEDSKFGQNKIRAVAFTHWR